MPAKKTKTTKPNGFEIISEGPVDIAEEGFYMPKDLIRTKTDKPLSITDDGIITKVIPPNPPEVMEAIPKDHPLGKIITASDLEATKARALFNKFQDSFAQAEEWEATAKTIIVKDEHQKVAMATAKTMRLQVRQKRLDIEATRKTLKESSIREGKAIDGIANILKALLAPIEEHLEAQEKFIERKEAEAKRVQDEIDRKARDEEERKAREAEQARQQAIRDENDRLRRENEEKDRIIREERDRDFKERRDREEKERRDRVNRENQQREERAQHERELQAARDEAARQVCCPACGHTFTPELKDSKAFVEGEVGW